MQLTPVGQAFLRRATAIHHEIQRARDGAGQLRGAVNGRVTLGMSTAPHLELFPDVLPAFRARFPDIHLEIVDGVYPLVEARCWTVPWISTSARRPRACRASCGSKLFDNTRVILGRKGHPLAQAKSLRELATPTGSPRPSPTRPRKNWARCSKHGLPAPKLAMRAQSALTFLTALPSSDLLMMLPVQWLRYPLLRDTFQEIKVREKLPAPPVCIVQRTGLPLTPAAEHYCTLLRAPPGTSGSGSARWRRQPSTEVQAARVQRDGSDPAGSTAWPS